jgi:hypothetical protein
MCWTLLSAGYTVNKTPDFMEPSTSDHFTQCYLLWRSRKMNRGQNKQNTENGWWFYHVFLISLAYYPLHKMEPTS